MRNGVNSTKEKIVLTVPDQYRKQYLEGEQASFDEEPHSCRYTVGSDDSYWWTRGYEAAENLNDEISQ